jgi:hypothetical protein
MSRTTIAAVLAMLLLLAPAANARPLPERITDHPAPKADVGSLVREQESTSGSGNQGVVLSGALAQERAYSTYGEPAPVKSQPAPVAATDDDTPWPLIGAGFVGTVLLLGLAVVLVARQRRPRVAT